MGQAAATRAETGATRMWTHTVEQIDRALAFKGSCKAAGVVSGVSYNAVKRWRSGDLPLWYVEAKAKSAAAFAERRALRFYKPQDARASR